MPLYAHHHPVSLPGRPRAPRVLLSMPRSRHVRSCKPTQTAVSVLGASRRGFGLLWLALSFCRATRTWPMGASGLARACCCCCYSNAGPSEIELLGRIIGVSVPTA